MKKKLTIFALFFAMILCFTGCDFNLFSDEPTRTFSYQSTYSSPVAIQNGSNITDIAEAYEDCCVTVFIVKKSDDSEISFGSGVCVYAGNYIVTNHHVVSTYLEMPSIYKVMVYTNKSFTAIPAKVLWSNTDVDMAVIQCSNADIPYVTIKDRSINAVESEKLRVLEQVITIGTPIDFSLQNWCSTGYISKLNCYSSSNSNLYEDLIGHTSSINHGNSGGPLFDLYGNLVGLNTLGNDEANSIFFAVPIYPLTLVLDRIVTLNEEPVAKTLAMPKVGVTIYDGMMGYYDNKDTTPNDVGLYVSEITANGASVGKVFVNDIIKTLKNGTKTFNIVNRNSLAYALMASNVGDEVTLTITRAGVNIDVTVTLK